MSKEQRDEHERTELHGQRHPIEHIEHECVPLGGGGESEKPKYSPQKKPSEGEDIKHHRPRLGGVRRAKRERPTLVLLLALKWSIVRNNYRRAESQRSGREKKKISQTRNDKIEKFVKTKMACREWGQRDGSRLSLEDEDRHGKKPKALSSNTSLDGSFDNTGSSVFPSKYFEWESKVRMDPSRAQVCTSSLDICHPRLFFDS
jgi:hypothetical protein